MGWLKCHLSFAILCSAIMCLQESRSSYHHLIYCNPALAVHESRVCLCVFVVIVLTVAVFYIIITKGADKIAHGIRAPEKGNTGLMSTCVLIVDKKKAFNHVSPRNHSRMYQVLS